MTDMPELADLITIDVTFTSLTKILERVKKLLKPEGKVIGLLKPQYESQGLAIKNKGVIPENFREQIVAKVIVGAVEAGYTVLGQIIANYWERWEY